ncbi:MAG: signal peptide peptidase SppA [Peptostreptococcaceae bacterium]|nr:signal peptide peptidase SppA [Peptostreptococcaceae bacterium]
MNENQDKENMSYDDYKVAQKENKGKRKISKGLIIFLVVVVAVVLLGVSCNRTINNIMGGVSQTDSSIDFSDDYIAVISVEGTIADSSSSILETETYNHQFTMDAIDDIIDDNDNKGLIIQVNSPGGSVYTSDELYLKILEYKETGRPVYSAMGSMAASGGYYISAPADKIIANRNCWTGSIGVKIGTIYDATELLKNIGIKTETITSGDNKNMGSYYEEMTEEQEDIFQGLVDEAYEQFVGIVADGRNMTVDQVKVLADGRIYTAKQALENGLIDEIGDYEYAINMMKSDNSLETCDVKYLFPEEETDIFSFLTGSALFNSTSLASEYKEIMDVVGNSESFTVTYMSNVIK